jgi:hypothetical protein
MALTRGKSDGKGYPANAANEMDFGLQPATGAPEGLIGGIRLLRGYAGAENTRSAPSKRGREHTPFLRGGLEHQASGRRGGTPSLVHPYGSIQ